MATDDYMTYFKYTPPVYPVTVTYDWSVQISNGFISFPSFSPQTDYNVEVKHASYKLTSPASEICRFKCINTNCKVNKTSVDGNTVIDVSLDSLQSILKEPYSKPIFQLIPRILFEPVDFQFKDTSGSMASWHDLGMWFNGLLAGRDILTDDAKTRIHQLTDTCKDVKSKIVLLYKLLEKSTRYVSIQLGIGGMQPMAASEVCNTGFGDCKGLSNYMRAMLKEVDIPSNYAIISTHENRQLSNFPCLDLFNHAILQVPLKGDTIWIECTAPDLAIGYVHSDIAGHDALVMTNEGGILCRLPEYADSANLQRSAIDVNLSTDGLADIHMSQYSYLRQYEDKLHLVADDDSDRKDYINDVMKVPSSDISKMDVTVHKQSYSVPAIQIETVLSSRGYVNITGSRFFLPINPTHKGFYETESTGPRKYEIYRSYGYLDEEDITIHIPQGFIIEARPRDSTYQSPFGTLTFSVACKDKDINVHYKLLMKKGLFGINTYSQLHDFMQSVSSLYNQKMVLKKM